MKHVNVALFVPNCGCPHLCSFCDQRAITGRQSMPAPRDVRAAAEIALKTPGRDPAQSEIAFFGGSFTAIDRADMISLLEAAFPYVRSGAFRGIRISTRPDCIDEEILGVLKRYGVTTIELGAQSMDDAVLARNGRGHTAEQTARASGLIRSRGFALGLQMMTGLPGDSGEGARRTAEGLAALRPACVRIYPTIVLKGTRLGEWFREGTYRPQTLEEAVEQCAGLLDFFESRGIPVIRLGLHASPELQNDRLAGPWHPAFRELCESRRMLRAMLERLREAEAPPGRVRVRVSPRSVSAAVGQKRQNLSELAEKGYAAEIVPDPSVPRGACRIE